MTKVIRSMALLAAAFGMTTPAARAGDLNIGLTITGEIIPGVYGRVDLSNRPAPRLVYAQPILIDQPPEESDRVEPIYLHVPPEHAKDWRRHCHEYHACNRPVYFVRSQEYEPGYRPGRDRSHEHHDRDDGHDRHDHDHDHDHDRDHDDHDHHDHDHDHER
jgi:hypothetical protein